MTIPNRGLTSSITSGIIGSDHCYSPKELEKQRVDELERQRKVRKKEQLTKLLWKKDVRSLKHIRKCFRRKSL